MNALAASLFVHPASYAGPVRVLGGGVRACTHLARMNIPGLPLACVKAFPISAGQGLFNEIGGFVLARSAGLDVAGGGILPVPLSTVESLFPQAQFPGVAFASQNGMVECFVSSPVCDTYGAMSANIYQTADGKPSAIAALLMRWDQFGRLLAFDQWIGNHDRNDGNVLIGPGCRPLPIDHSDCFWGPDFFDGIHDQPLAWTCMKAMYHLPEPSRWPPNLRSAILQECDRWVSVYARAHAEIAQLREWLPEPIGLRWMHWLWKRSEITRDLWAERLAML